MQIETLDHVALWAEDRDGMAAFLTTHVGMHVIDRTDRFTLVGSDARRGKLTLFAADGQREAGALLRIGLRVRDLEAALSRLPAGLEIERSGASARFQAPEALGLTLIERADVDVEYDLDHVTFVVRDPDLVYREFSHLGFRGGAGGLSAGDASINLVNGNPGDPERPQLNHLGLRVESVDKHIAEAREMGLEIADIVDAPNTVALFVWGPERIKLEYVEHKPSFSLA